MLDRIPSYFGHCRELLDHRDREENLVHLEMM